MRWYSGEIAEAVGFSKVKGAVFVVYIEGKDDKSQQITSCIDSEEVSSKLGSDSFVAIKVEAGSVPHQQFSEFYKETPVPSIYFIGRNGSPIKIITEASSPDNLSKELDNILVKAGIKPISLTEENNASESGIKSEQSPNKPDNVVCENGVCKIQNDPKPSAETPSTSNGDQANSSNEDKLERAKKLLEMKRLEKERQEEENEKLKELERRKLGQEVQKLKKWQEDQELKQLKDEREKEKRLEKEARDRVLAQIAQDKAERAAKFQPAASSTPTNNIPQPSTNKSDPNTTKLQFKLPDGSSKTQDFPSTDKLLSVVNFVTTNFNLSKNKFTLSTTFPRRQFTETDHTQTLTELQLTPNAVILVLPLNHGTVSTNAGPGGFGGFIWTLLAPIFGIFKLIKAFLGFGGDTHVSGDQPSTSGSTLSGRRKPSKDDNASNSSTTIKKQGNIRRLTDIKKDDDDNNTWNGNSTQQM
ncbi:hypothetical protein ABEB36_006954 [Hypothenemus hampei]|uniref:UBX domain-containing protein 4 n=1 Tax=Hypothenemus hampei TaxID=57062 RepID=A0ABD1ES82_HYPHA